MGHDFSRCLAERIAVIVSAPTSDAGLLDLLRTTGPMGVADMAQAMEVTPTAVRQRLGRVMAQGLVDREPVRAGRGRPKHCYRLTDKGLRITGSNFTDLALALWQQIGSIEDRDLRRTLLWRVIHRLVESYAHQVEGATTAERMESLAELLAERRLPFSVENGAELPVLTAHACPYPELAEKDPTICVFERLLFSELVQCDLQLARCRLQGGASCEFRGQ
jgi:predicted ArsR family transcriptional regulator